uniref:reverse transcriptase domain-containing protein n=1 Tax=Acinetobacter baumannii TaxID=470 RepID=UPI00339A3F21
VYGELSAAFPTVSGVRQGCPLSPFLFNFVIDEIMEECLKGTTESGVQVLPGDKLVDLDYADDIVLLFDCQATAQRTLDRLSEVVPSFGMRFAPPKCKVLPQYTELRWFHKTKNLM